MHLFLLAALVTSIPPVQASVPNRQPQLTSGAGITALVFGSGNSVWFSASHDAGHSFSPPVELAHVPVLALGRHRGPRIVISGKTILVSAVYGETSAAGPHAHGLPADGDLVVWRSTDGGRLWSRPTVINDVSGSAREGLHAIAVGSHGELAAVWLDLRSTGTKLYGSNSEDDGVTWSKNVLLYESPEGTICQCCDPSIVSSGEHQFNVMFRNVLAGTRDMYLAKWNLGQPVSAPQKLGAGSWNLNACPMDGGGLVWNGNRAVSAWRRDQTVYLDEPGKPEIALGTGKDVALSVSATGPYVAWANTSGIEVFCSSTKKTAAVSAAGSFPVLTSLPNGKVLVAWEQDGQIRVEAVD